MPPKICTASCTTNSTHATASFLATTASRIRVGSDFEVSTAVLDALVDRLVATPGVYGARLTGAGFGGCVVAVADPGALDEGWLVRPADGARLL